MPIKRIKYLSKKNNKTHTKSIHSINTQPHLNDLSKPAQHNLIDLISMIRQASKNRSKTQSNLPARLIKMNKMNKNKPRMSPFLQMSRHTSRMLPHNIQTPESFKKSVSSSYSSIIKDGEQHSEGKQIINDSTKPFIRINEIQDGQIQQYMVPKNTIPYNVSNDESSKEPIIRSPMFLSTPVHSGIPMDIKMRMQVPKASIVIYSATSKKTPKKTSKKTPKKTPKASKKTPKASKSKKK